MKVSIVISIKNRTDLFRRSLKQYKYQTMPKSDWELVVVDDMSDEDVLSVLKKYGSCFNYKYIKIDSKKNDFPVFWGPSLSNNVGFKAAEGDVVVITSPEVMVDYTALDNSYNMAMTGVSAFGHVLFSHNQFVQMMDKNPKMEEYSFYELFRLPTATNGFPDINSKNFYWFWLAVKRDVVLSIGGCDENFMRGICGDDDDFADRLKLFGAEPTHAFNIKGIHQDHKVKDSKDPKRIRRNSVWERYRKINTDYLAEKRRTKEVVANVGRNWGSEKLIISVFENKI